jgi:hypothetical protein
MIVKNAQALFLLRSVAVGPIFVQASDRRREGHLFASESLPIA